MVLLENFEYKTLIDLDFLGFDDLSENEDYPFNDNQICVRNPATFDCLISFSKYPENFDVTGKEKLILLNACQRNGIIKRSF